MHRINADSNLGFNSEIVSGLTKFFLSALYAITGKDACVLNSDLFNFGQELVGRDEAVRVLD